MSRVIVALDFSDLHSAKALASELVSDVGGFKVGLELLSSEGPGAVESIVDLGAPVFLDAKLHDIPNTVGKAARELARTGARWVTVHASGGSAMLEAAVDGFGRGVLAVSVLTSLDGDDLKSIGVTNDPLSQVAALTLLAAQAGAEGAVCSPQEISAVAPGLLTFVPGVRPEGSPTGDQKRVMTPVAAVESGADFLVIGRPIAGSQNPSETLRQINTSLAQLPLTSGMSNDR